MDKAGRASPETGALAKAWLEHVEAPFAIVDQGLRLHWANGPAQIEFQRRAVLEVRDESLASTDGAHQEGLHAFVQAARRHLSTWCLRREGGHLLLRALELHRDHMSRYVGLSFIDTTSFEPVYADLDKAFDLTEREHRILRSLINARRPEEIAQEMGVRMPTVRTHIRNLYEKLDVTCREELFRRVSPFRI